ncbi:hypothetical protein E6O75_ATG07547 [Venturia nashicola]|uniref:Uncharacterized protein n=1 Tax=Venturia nashicola TaxID=86259 RepID=A0A4Z1NVE9_9PEZI|nr:hypothetical protein E6O75_ATG07547 [Venturia nashicola]
MESNQKTSRSHDDAPNDGKPAVHTTTTAETTASTRSTEVSSSTNGPRTSDDDTNTYPPVPTQMYQSQNLEPVGMIPQSTNHFTSALFTQQPPETNGLVATNHSYAHYAPPNSTQEQLLHPLSPLANDEELMSRALYEVRRQLNQDIDPSPQPAHWPNQFDQSHDAGLITSYESPSFHNLYPSQAATQTLQHAFLQDQTTQQSLVMPKGQSLTFSTQQTSRFDRYEHGQPVQYHLQNGPGHLQTSEIPSQTRLQSHSQSPSSDDLPSVTAKEQKEKKQSKKRPRRGSSSQLQTQPKQIGEEPSKKRPRREAKTQHKSQDQEPPRGVSNAMPPQLPKQDNPTIAPALVDSAFDAEPTKRVSPNLPFLCPHHYHEDEITSLASLPISPGPSNPINRQETIQNPTLPHLPSPSLNPKTNIPKPTTVSAQLFHTRAKRLLAASNSRSTTRPTPEREIAYEIASTLMLADIYLDSKSDVDESAAWLEWAFSMEGFWKRRPIARIPHAVPEALLRIFEDVYGNGGKVPIFDGDGRVICDGHRDAPSITAKQ